MGAVIGHELTHGFDDQGSQFDANGNLNDWWTPGFAEARTGCLVNEYGSFVAVDDLHVNGKLTLGENTADNGEHWSSTWPTSEARGHRTGKKIEGFTGPQRFYIAFGQNWCENSGQESTRERVQTDPHSPDRFRANGAINQPSFAPPSAASKASP